MLLIAQLVFRIVPFHLWVLSLMFLAFERSLISQSSPRALEVNFSNSFVIMMEHSLARERFLYPYCRV